MYGDRRRATVPLPLGNLGGGSSLGSCGFAMIAKSIDPSLSGTFHVQIGHLAKAERASYPQLGQVVGSAWRSTRRLAQCAAFRVLVHEN